MTQLLERAFIKAKSLPDAEQDNIAALIIEELEDERRWENAFVNSQDKLAKLSAKVDADVKAGRVCELGIDEL